MDNKKKPTPKKLSFRKLTISKLTGEALTHLVGGPAIIIETDRCSYRVKK